MTAGPLGQVGLSAELGALWVLLWLVPIGLGTVAGLLGIVSSWAGDKGAREAIVLGVVACLLGMTGGAGLWWFFRPGWWTGLIPLCVGWVALTFGWRTRK